MGGSPPDAAPAPEGEERKSCLLVEDDPVLRRILRQHLAKEGWAVVTAPTLDDARLAVTSQRFGVVLTDVMLPDGSGFDLITELARVEEERPEVIVMTSDGAVDHAITAVRHGATDFLMKPFSMNALDAALSRVQVVRSLSIPPPDGSSMGDDIDEWRARHAHDIIGEDPSLLRVFNVIARIADTDCTVLVTGESGTGKELIARTIHSASTRRNGPFMAVNCAAIPEGLLESELFGHSRGAFTGANQARLGRFAAADGGSIFLDEIGELPLGLQAKILRLLQEKEVTPLGETRAKRLDVRVIAATNADLEEMVRKQTFRQDLLYRLNVIQIELPALRQRRSDIPLLVDRFVAAANKRRGRTVRRVEARAMEALSRYDWPGNIRELENTVERMVLLQASQDIRYDDLPDKIRRTAVPVAAASRSPWDEPILPEEGLDLREALTTFENALIRQALERVGGNKNRAAALLQINRTTLVEKLKKKELGGKVTADDEG